MQESDKYQKAFYIQSKREYTKFNNESFCFYLRYNVEG